MTEDRHEEQTARPEQTEHGFAEGLDHKPDSPEEKEVGSFSTGVEQTPEHTPEKEHVGRFSEGVEQTGETEEKLTEGQFSDGVERSDD